MLASMRRANSGAGCPFSPVSYSHPLFGVDQLSLFHSFSEVFGHIVRAVFAPPEFLHIAVDGEGGLAGQALQNVAH